MRSIPNARSKWEAAVRRIIGGGSLRTWDKDSKMLRGGGDISDALLLLGQAIDDSPGQLLRDLFPVEEARKALSLPEGLRVPDGLEDCRMRNFNNDATAGPFLLAFGVGRKLGLKEILEEEMWQYYDGYASGRLTAEQMPFFAARVGFRSKLMEEEEAWKKMKGGKPLGRAVMMMDALEQAAMSPLYNVLSKLTFSQRLSAGCGFKNAIVKASADWGKLWEEVRKARVIVELDWAKFDRERPAEDIELVIKVILSCFAPRSPREERLLEAYGLMMRRALVERMVVLDDGGVFEIDGMVPSGSLWTGWLDTALNILYIRAACVEAGFAPSSFSPLCAGDDNLTLFFRDRGDRDLLRFKELLNTWFRAGIKDEDFLIHRPPFHVRRLQACFPPGTALGAGTSAIIREAQWVEFDGEIVIDEAAGKSHRWEYEFRGKPKFLSNYWLVDGQPIRPTSDNLEKLLWPEGIHEDFDDYQSALMAMVVDNPWNHHCVNHMLMRFVILQQLRRVTVVHGSADDVCFFSALREKGGGEVPFPMVAPWRRGSGHRRMEDYAEVQQWVKAFSQFVRGVTSLYARSAKGGLDAWLFTQIIRGESHVGEGQFGNDMVEWLQFISDNPCTKYLKAVRGLRPQGRKMVREALDFEKARDALEVLRDQLLRGRIRSSEEFALFVSQRLQV